MLMKVRLKVMKKRKEDEERKIKKIVVGPP